MIRTLDKGHDNILGFTVSGDVSDSDYETAVSEMRDAIAKHGKIRVLFKIDDISPKSFFQGLDERFDFLKHNREDVERVAIVKDGIAAEMFATVSDLMPKIEVDRFDTADEAKAWEWLK